MIIKKKDMCKTNWNRCLEKEYKYQKFEFDDIDLAAIEIFDLLDD